MAEKTDTDDDVSFQGEALLSLKELILKASAAAKGYHREFAYHKQTKKPIRI